MTKKVILILLFFAVILPLLAVFLPKNYNSESVFSENIFTIKIGEGSAEISSNLENRELIWWGPAFRIYVFLSGTQNKLQAGSYWLSQGMNVPAIAKKFISGDVAKEKITFPEGFDAEQIYQKISDFTQANPADLKEYEGYLFPDTYLIPYGAGSQEVIKIMTDNFDKKTAGLKFSKEDIILASILEREVITKEDKQLVAGLLLKRMQAGMPLQVDAAPETYQRRGLPESPICNPGLESIEAALLPKASLYWYFLSTPEGKTIFSKTLQEHNVAVAKYLK